MKEEASMDQLFLEKVQEAIEKNLANENFGVDELAHEIGISRSQLHRRLKSLNRQSASQMIREFRLKKAHEMLLHKVATASEISYQVGFSSPSYFNTCFHEYYGYPPGKVKRIRSRGPTKKISISRKLLIISLSTFVVVVSVFVLYLIVSERSIEPTGTSITDKSIAVLPFKSLSLNPEMQYLAEGVMDAILLHLSKIEDLRVVDRTSVEQYRESDKTSIIISKELDVAYLLEGSFQIYGDQSRTIVNLIKPGKVGHIWSEEYNNPLEYIFSVQSKVAETIASELQAIITPEEKQLIEKIPTTDLTAYDFYLRGKEELQKYELDQENRESMERAEKHFRKALEYDSTYAQAYAGLGWVYKNKNFWETYLSENFLDSMLILADIALAFDNQLAEAYLIRGDYYRVNNNKKKAIQEYDQAIRFNPNDWQAYWHKGELYYYDDYVEILDNLHKAASLHRGHLLPILYRAIGSAYGNAGFKQKSIDYAKKVLKLDDDSARFYGTLGGTEETYGNFEKAIEFYEKSLAIDSTHWGRHIRLGMTYCFIGQYDKYLEHLKKYEERYNTYEETNPSWIIYIGHAYWKNGFKEEADHYLDAGLENQNKLLELDRHFARDIYIYKSLAAIHAFKGDKNKAYDYLRRMNQSQRFPYFEIKDLQNDLLFESIRDEPEYQQIVRDVEAKVQAEHDRVKKWLEENDIL